MEILNIGTKDLFITIIYAISTKPKWGIEKMKEGSIQTEPLFKVSF